MFDTMLVLTLGMIESCLTRRISFKNLTDLTDSLQTLHCAQEKFFSDYSETFTEGQNKFAHHFRRLWMQHLHESTRSRRQGSCGGVHWVLRVISQR